LHDQRLGYVFTPNERRWDESDTYAYIGYMCSLLAVYCYCIREPSRAERRGKYAQYKLFILLDMYTKALAIYFLSTTCVYIIVHYCNLQPAHPESTILSSIAGLFSPRYVVLLRPLCYISDRQCQTNHPIHRLNTQKIGELSIYARIGSRLNPLPSPLLVTSRESTPSCPTRDPPTPLTALHPHHLPERLTGMW